MFGIDRMDTEKDLTVLFYNMGGTDTEVSVVRYSTIPDAKNKTSEYVEIMGEGFDQHLGGNDFDMVLFNMFVEKFNALPERKGKADVRTNQRAIKRLMKEANTQKEILSANKSTIVKISELLDYVTLKVEVQRSEFEEACASLL